MASINPLVALDLPAPTAPLDAALWERIGEILDRAPSTDMLFVHGVDLLAAWRMRSVGASVPEELQARERLVRAIALAVPVLLQRIRNAVDGPIILMKGPELARLYPEQSRSYGDVDLLVADARRAQHALIAAGFEEVSDPELYVDIHHLRPLMWPSLPLKVELHTRPKWPDGVAAPAFADLIDDAEPSHLMPEGLLTLPQVQHAVAVAAHAWAHVPLRALRDLVDLAAVSSGIDRNEARAFAGRWGVERIWDTSIRAADSLLGAGGTRSLPLTVWARHIPELRERTVIESHVEEVLSPFWAVSPRRATVLALLRFGDTFRRAQGDSVWEKCRRAALALRHAFTARSIHDGALGSSASRWRRRSRH